MVLIHVWAIIRNSRARRLIVWSPFVSIFCSPIFIYVVNKPSTKNQLRRYCHQPPPFHIRSIMVGPVPGHSMFWQFASKKSCAKFLISANSNFADHTTCENLDTSMIGGARSRRKPPRWVLGRRSQRSIGLTVYAYFGGVETRGQKTYAGNKHLNWWKHMGDGSRHA